MKGKIINCFYEGSSSGFGDFLRGSIDLYKKAKAHNLTFDIDVSHHPINKFIKTNYKNKFDKNIIKCITKETEKEKPSNYGQLYNDKLFKELINTKENETNYIFSYYHYLTRIKNEFLIKKTNELPKLSKDCRSFFKESLNFSNDVEEEVKKCLADNGLKRKKFNIIHFRLGDEKAFYKSKERFYTPEFEDCFRICKQKAKKSKHPIVIISDSNELKTLIKEKTKKEKLPFFVFHLESSHTQEKPGGCEESGGKALVTEEGLFYASFDMRLISLANRGYSYSVYEHGSGFFCWLCKIYEIPFVIEKFSKNK
tara:strand:- start:17 stop:949 length:933 start_codon:yes stop_codon:yes gene_type:complete